MMASGPIVLRNPPEAERIEILAIEEQPLARYKLG
jgi:hypothetical protein